MADFHMIDVFGSGGCSGNPLPVIHVADALTTDQIQAITRWFGVSETTFLVPPTDPAADYRVRIFTLDREMPFAGHPTLGTCHAWLEAGGQARDPAMIVQECGAGLVRIRREADTLAFAPPPLLRDGPVDEAMLKTIADFLSIDRSTIVDSRWIDNGPGWVGVLLGSAEEVLALGPPAAWPDRIELGVVGPHPAGHDCAYEVRAFFSGARREILEDPVTGSLNASVAGWMVESGRAAPPYVAAQGTRLGRTGRVMVTGEPGALWIGGRTETIASGTTILA